MIKALVAKVLNQLRTQKLSQNIAYTLVSFMVLAVSGIVINITITGLRNPTALGIFNLAYAVYIVASQFAVWGIHYSVLRHSAYYSTDENEKGKLLFTAAISCLVLGFFSAVLIYIAKPVFTLIFKSEITARAIAYSSLGLSLFPLSKVLLAYLNGLHEMKAFSVLQGLRYVAVMLLVAILAASSLSIEFATLSFFFAELITVSLASFFIIKKKLVIKFIFDKKWFRQHFAFGTKGLMSGLFAEVNSRLDVMLVGFFLTSRDVGIYSFAAMLVDGLYHVLAMVRINFNPILVSFIRDKEWDKAKNLLIQARKYILPIMCVLALLLLAVYYIYTAIIIPQKGLQYGLLSLVILLTGLVSVSFLVPFDNLMMVSGHPGYQTFQQVAMVGSNLLCAALLLPFIGIEGAAIGTAVGYLIGILVLVVFAKRLVGWNLLANKIIGVN